MDIKGIAVFVIAVLVVIVSIGCTVVDIMAKLHILNL